MSKFLKILAGIIILLVIALGIFIATFDVNRYKGDLIEVVEKQTGRDFDIAGEMQLGFSLIPTVVVDGVTLGNADWGSKPSMLSVKHFKARVSLPALLSGNISINEIVLDSADIQLETNKDGQGNWVFKTAGEKPATEKKDAGAAAAPELSVEEVQIKNANITYIDTQNKKTTQVNIEQLTVEAGGFLDPMDLQLRAAYNEIPVRVDGTIGSLGALTGNEEFPMDVSANLGKSELTLKGHVSKPKDMKGMDIDMTFKSESLADFEKIAGKELPKTGPLQIAGHISEKDGTYFIKALKANVADSELGVDGKVTNPQEAQGLDLMISFEAESLQRLGEVSGTELPAIGPVKLSTHLTDKDKTWQLGDLKLQAGQTDLSGNASLNMTGKRPALTAALNSSLIDLTPFMGEEEQGKDEKKKKKSDKVFSSEPLPFDTLKAADANLDIKAKQVRSPDLVLNDVNIKLNLNNGRLKLSPVNANVAGGTYALNLDLDASSGKSGIFDTVLDIKNFQPSKLPDMQDQISGASTDFSFKGKGAGGSVAAIMAGLNGHLLVKVGPGEIKSDKFSILDSDLIASTLNTINPVSSSEGGRKIECGVVNMKIEDGIAKSDENIALLTNRMSVVGSGIINLKTEELNIAVKPRAREGIGISAGNLAELVKVGGTLAEPK
ncbi:MAG TPA: AsmA family protein, partial [Gammaproteobacteria bacterium]|nr:AsmA family protein [Gammaproteobacteria bacterium]